MSIKCFSCVGILDTKCENASTEVECKPSGQLVYDSCYTVQRIMDYPLIGRRMEQIKNCSVLADCGFLETLLCENTYGFINSCSIQCCTGNLCNNKTFQLTQGSVTRGNLKSTVTRTNFTRAITSHVTLTRKPGLTSGISMTSSPSITRISKTTKTSMRTSWTSVKSQHVLSSSTHALPTTKAPSADVEAVCANANRFIFQLRFLLLMAILGSSVMNGIM